MTNPILFRKISTATSTHTASRSAICPLLMPEQLSPIAIPELTNSSAGSTATSPKLICRQFSEAIQTTLIFLLLPSQLTSATTSTCQAGEAIFLGTRPSQECHCSRPHNRPQTDLIFILWDWIRMPPDLSMALILEVTRAGNM